VRVWVAVLCGRVLRMGGWEGCVGWVWDVWVGVFGRWGVG
jgi:hypothetical protein